MSKFVNLTGKDFKLPPRYFPCGKQELITTQELSERCAKAAEAYGPSFYEYISERYSTGDE